MAANSAKARKRHAGDSPSSVYVLPSDASDEDDFAHVGSSQSSQSQSQTSLDRSEMGVIEEIYCENFMCHRKMVVKLGRNINFITGENGSGKSAIIAALQICLGASARTTHRGKSLKNLIRNSDQGEQPRSALVRITLLNDGTSISSSLCTLSRRPLPIHNVCMPIGKGTDAFRPEQFGTRIQVERLIRIEGTAEYRLKDMDGRVVSKAKADLEAMLDHLNIQIDNPCAVLDQENAKLFLKGDPADKYKHHLAWSFVRVKETEYETLREELEQCQTKADSYKKHMAKYQAQVEVLTADQHHLNESLELETEKLANLDKQQQELKHRQRQLRYPQQIKEAERKQLEHNLQKSKKRLVEIEKDKLKKRQRYQEYMSSLEHKQAQSAKELDSVQLRLDDALDQKRHLETLAVELILKNVLNSYLVASGPDKALFDRLKAKAKCGQVSILIAKRSSHKYSGLHVPTGSLQEHAVASIVSVDDPNVFNALVDIAKIESKVNDI
ncbi:hypothetical protein B5M09_010311 [Aphanomyces astaci]|uniref:Rad50/SbcC-type AAA domain-containing protein n=1 Tax=Aphanomyces astaci TaxID=112090 RepID=A0A3R7XQT2_APHAT|nr:hypothetical protein B5M09_010311 [Aphanomyces astaci]